MQGGESRGETGALTGGRRRAWTRRRQQSWWGEWSDSECVLKEEKKEFVMSGVGQKERKVKDNHEFEGRTRVSE